MPGLSIVIPACNPSYIFHQAIESIARQHSDWQIIIIDDHSEIDISRHFLDLPNIEVYRNRAQLGAGASRNIGIGHIARDYTIFLDDDDEMHWDVVETLVAKMEGDTSIDVSFCLYDLLLNGMRRSAREHDCMIMSQALQGSSERIVSLWENEKLFVFTNYPWNKIYRSSFIKSANLRFSETPVQNDVFAHWATLLRAKRILVSSHVLCTKVEYDHADRIGNTSDSRCALAFQSLLETYHLVRDEGTKRYGEVFLRFYLNLVRWLIRKSSAAMRHILFQEHNNFVALMRSEGYLDYAGSAIRSWEFWDLPDIDGSAKECQTPITRMVEPTEYSIVLAEMSRLKHLVLEIRNENDAERAARETTQAENEAIGIENHALRDENDTIKIQNQTLREEQGSINAEIQALRAENDELTRLNHSMRQILSRRIVKISLLVGDRLSMILRGGKGNHGLQDN